MGRDIVASHKIINKKEIEKKCWIKQQIFLIIYTILQFKMKNNKNTREKNKTLTILSTLYITPYLRLI